MERRLYNPSGLQRATAAPTPRVGVDNFQMQKVKAATTLDLSMLVDWDPTLVYFKYILCHAIPFFNANNASWLPEVIKNSYQTIINKAINRDHWEDYIVGHTYDVALIEDALLDGVLAVECAGVIYRDIFCGTANDVMAGSAQISMECYYSEVGLYFQGNVMDEQAENYETIAEYAGSTYNGDPVVRLLGGIQDTGKVIFGASGIVGVPADPNAREQETLYLDNNLKPQHVVFEEAASAKTEAFTHFSKSPMMLDGGTMRNKSAVEDRVEALSRQAEASVTAARASRDETTNRFMVFNDNHINLKPEQVQETAATDEEPNSEVTEAGIYRVTYCGGSTPSLTLDIRGYDGTYTPAFSLSADADTLADLHEHLLSDIDEAMASEAPSLIEQIDEILNNPVVPTSTYSSQVDKSEIQALADAAFTLILPGGTKDEEGRTQPSNKRVLAHHQGAVQRSNHNGSVNPVWLRGALATYSLVDVPSNLRRKGYAHLVAHAKTILQEWQNHGSISCVAIAAENTSHEDPTTRSETIMSIPTTPAAAATPEVAQSTTEDASKLDALMAQIEGLDETVKTRFAEMEGTIAGLTDRLDTAEAAGRTESRKSQLAALTLVPEDAAEKAATLDQPLWDMFITTLAGMQPKVEAATPAATPEAPAAETASEQPAAQASATTEGTEPAAIPDAEEDGAQTEAAVEPPVSTPAEPQGEAEQTAGTVDPTPTPQAQAEAETLPADPQERIIPTEVPDKGGFVMTGPGGERIAGAGPGAIPTYEDVHEDYAAKCNAQWRNKPKQ